MPLVPPETRYTVEGIVVDSRVEDHEEPVDLTPSSEAFNYPANKHRHIRRRVIKPIVAREAVLRIPNDSEVQNIQQTCRN
jgi:hypothetical protein